jgi:hypothetical protein
MALEFAPLSSNLPIMKLDSVIDKSAPKEQTSASYRCEIALPIKK